MAARWSRIAASALGIVRVMARLPSSRSPRGKHSGGGGPVAPCRRAATRRGGGGHTPSRSDLRFLPARCGRGRSATGACTVETLERRASFPGACRDVSRPPAGVSGAGEHKARPTTRFAGWMKEQGLFRHGSRNPLWAGLADRKSMSRHDLDVHRAPRLLRQPDTQHHGPARSSRSGSTRSASASVFPPACSA